eukprot:4723902-Lingulodinium_polyedra.AAC.1
MVSVLAHGAGWHRGALPEQPPRGPGTRATNARPCPRGVPEPVSSVDTQGPSLPPGQKPWAGC